jgi:hypothetical protein
VSVPPFNAVKLATVSGTPAELLAWLCADVPPAERAPWIPGSANALRGLVQSIAEAMHLAPKPPEVMPPPGPAYRTEARRAAGAAPRSTRAWSTAPGTATAGSRASTAAGPGRASAAERAARTASPTHGDPAEGARDRRA